MRNVRSAKKSDTGRIKRSFRFESAFKTDAADYREDENEDTILHEPRRGLFGVFDGAGGMIDGAAASRTACIAIRKHLVAFDTEALDDVVKQMGVAIFEAHKCIQEQGGGESGSTASILQLWPDHHGKLRAIVGNIGDSRVYRLDTNRGNLEKITFDDFFGIRTVDDPAKVLEHLDAAESLKNLTEREQALYDDRNMVSQLLGQREDDESLTLCITKFVVRQNDRFLLVSDGVHDNLTASEIKEIVGAGNLPDETAEELIRRSKARSKEGHFRSKDDDMSAIVVDVRES